jgi:ribosomal protein S27E
MTNLKLKRYVTAEKARNHPSLSVVYICPECNISRYLQHISRPSGKVKCTKCNKIYVKP